MHLIRLASIRAGSASTGSGPRWQCQGGPRDTPAASFFARRLGCEPLAGGGLEEGMVVVVLFFFAGSAVQRYLDVWD